MSDTGWSLKRSVWWTGFGEAVLQRETERCAAGWFRQLISHPALCCRLLVTNPVSADDAHKRRSELLLSMKRDTYGKNSRVSVSHADFSLTPDNVTCWFISVMNNVQRNNSVGLLFYQAKHKLLCILSVLNCSNIADEAHSRVIVELQL